MFPTNWSLDDCIQTISMLGDQPEFYMKGNTLLGEAIDKDQITCRCFGHCH